jgi:hypothetical protein
MTLGCLAGCHSAFVQATVVNRTGGRVRLFEVDYPFASFGGQDLADGASFRYRFKILGSGPSKVIWTDASEHEHTAGGPALEEGEEGTLTLTLNPGDKASWDSDLTKAR